MRNSIIDKIRATLTEGVDTECEVVYLLCECRKLADNNTHAVAMPFSLRLYCNWALHVDLNHQGTTLPFLQQVDLFVASELAAGMTLYDLRMQHKMRREFSYLYTFKEQLADFLRSFNLPVDLCDDPGRWKVFLTQYAGVIEEGTISCNGKGAASLKQITEVIFRKGQRSPGPGEHLPFDLSWTIVLLNGRTLTVDANAITSTQTGELLPGSSSRLQ